MRGLLVVCEGNICRSPMAHVVLAQALPSVSVVSAGLGALVGNPADPIACKLVQELGLDLSAHRATQINAAMCGQAELVLVMEASQRARLEAMYPQVRGRVFRLGHYINQDVPDPYRRGEALFRQSLQTIQRAAQDWVSRIHKL